jgi:hypothetical protein
MYLALVSVPDRKNGMTIQATVSGAGTWDENLDGQHHTIPYTVTAKLDCKPGRLDHGQNALSKTNPPPLSASRGTPFLHLFSAVQLYMAAIPSKLRSA